MAAEHTKGARGSTHDKHTASHGSGKTTCGNCSHGTEVVYRNGHRAKQTCTVCGGRGYVSKGN